jgi:hypothetical protein
MQSTAERPKQQGPRRPPALDRTTFETSRLPLSSLNRNL